MENKEEEKMIEKKFKGDTGYSCNYCNKHSYLVKDCMLTMKLEKKEKVNDEEYYAMNIEELHSKSKNLFLVVKGTNDVHDTY